MKNCNKTEKIDKNLLMIPKVAFWKGWLSIFDTKKQLIWQNAISYLFFISQSRKIIGREINQRIKDNLDPHLIEF